MKQFVFVSHANSDKERIAPLIEALIEHNIDLWIDRPEEMGLKERFLNCGRIRRIPAGADWQQEIQSALKNAACVLFLLSNESNSFNRSDELFREFQYAAAHELLVMIQIDPIPPEQLNPFFGLRQAIELSAILRNETPDTATTAKLKVIVQQLRDCLANQYLLNGKTEHETLQVKTPITIVPAESKSSSNGRTIELRPPRLLPYLTDRVEQQRRIANVLQTQITRQLYQPLTFFAQGTEEDCLDSFVEQVRFTRIPTLLASNGLNRDIFFKALQWPVADESPMLGSDDRRPTVELQAQIAESVGLPPNASVKLIENRFHATQACWYFHVSIDGDTWSSGQDKVLRSWLDWWMALDHSQFAYPVMTFVCVALRSGILARLIVPQTVRRMRTDLKTIQSDARLGSFLHVLPAFKHVQFSDVEQWIREYGDEIDREVLKKLLSTKFSRTWSLRRRTLSMYDAAFFVKESLSNPSVNVKTL